MSAKSLEYWKKRWDEIKLEEGSEIKDVPVYKLLNLLKEYAGNLNISFYTSALYELTNNKLNWLFKGHWTNHHTTQVDEAIGEFFHAAGGMLYDSNYHNVKVVFALLREELKSTDLDSKGDLFRIIKTAENETGIKYDSINSREILKNIDLKEAQDSYKRNPTSESELDKRLEQIDRKWQYKEIWDEMRRLTYILKSEYESLWPCPNKALKLLKLDALNEFDERFFNQLEPIKDVVAQIKAKHPEIVNGRTKDLLDSIEKGIIAEQGH